ncbi:hypothetical protein RYX36_029401 [Vicia faba]
MTVTEHPSIRCLKVINNLASNSSSTLRIIFPGLLKAAMIQNCQRHSSFFVLLQSLLLIEPEGDGFSALFKSVFPILKAELESLVNGGDVLLDEFNSEMLEWDCIYFFIHLLYANLRPLNAKVLVCIF